MIVSNVKCLKEGLKELLNNLKTAQVNLSNAVDATMESNKNMKRCWVDKALDNIKKS